MNSITAGEIKTEKQKNNSYNNRNRKEREGREPIYPNTPLKLVVLKPPICLG